MQRTYSEQSESIELTKILRRKKEVTETVKES